MQGYFGGWIDLSFQRFLEIWSAMPTLYLLIILASFVEPSFWWLLGIMLLFSWMALVGVVRAEFLRARNFDYVRAARALGVRRRHASCAATSCPTPWSRPSPSCRSSWPARVTTLTALDFLGFGLPPGSPSLGELLPQGKNNLQAPWLGFTGFVVIALMLSLLVFIGEAVRDAFDPRKTFAGAGDDRRRLAGTRRSRSGGRHGLQPERAPPERCSRSTTSRSLRSTAAVEAVRRCRSHRPGRDRWRWSARAARASR